MKAIRINKSKLAASLKANRKKHANEVVQAKLDRHEAFKEQIEVWSQKVEDGNLQFDDIPELIKFPLVPDNLDEYDYAIKVCEMSDDDVIELSEHEFQQYVMDNWAWKGDFLRTSAMYKGALR